MKKQNLGIIKAGLTVLFAIFILFAVARAGILSPSSEPGPTMLSLSDLPTATEVWTSIPRSLTSFGTLVTDIVSGVWARAISELDDTTTIGGFIVDKLSKLDEPISSRATQSDILSDATPFKGADISDILTNTWDNKDILGGTYDAGSIIAKADGNVLEQLEFIQRNLGGYDFGSENDYEVLTTAGGTYDATNLIPAHVKKDIGFGVLKVGTYDLGSGTFTYGSDDPENVLTTAEEPGTGTYNASNLSVDTVKSGTIFGVLLTGALTPDGGTAGVADLFNEKTANLTNDWTLDPGTLTLACDTTTFDGIGNLVADAYDGDGDGYGDGTNRWCITDSGDAAAGDILSGKIAWVDGVAVTGTIDTKMLSAEEETVAAGYYDATTLSAVDTDLAAANILGGKTIFGIVGTLLANLFNGTGQGVTGGLQAEGGVDDYNAGVAAPSDRYLKGWTACNSGNNYCDTGDTGADAKDDSTGLVWSMPCNGSGCSSFSDASPLTYSWDSSAVNNNSRTASELCSDQTGWSLPHQKQLLQAYIDGSYGNAEAAGTSRDYWSATTLSDKSAEAWLGNLSTGNGGGIKKDGTKGTFYVRCVR